MDTKTQAVYGDMVICDNCDGSGNEPDADRQPCRFCDGTGQQMAIVWPCGQCGKVLATRSAVSRHYAKKHPNDKLIE